MFLNKVLSRNEKLIDAAVKLHQDKKIPANSYILDIDAIYENAKIMADICHKNNMKFFPMTKQIGRNPVAVDVLNRAGADGFVCVDMADARRVHRAGGKIGHLGHLVQVPSGETKAAVNMKPMFWTVFSMEKAREISEALPENQEQNILLRIYDNGDVFYTGHEGGFPADEIVYFAEKINSLPGLKFAGITSFPTQLFNKELISVEHTHNFKTLLKAKEKLEKAGFKNIEINAPGTTSSHMFEKMAAEGVTQVEPGHGLTGTTPMHAYCDLAEKPAVVYVSEVSHFYNNEGYCYGGGMYIDPVFEPYTVCACVGSESEYAKKNIIACNMPDPSSIDYYGIFEETEQECIKEGDTVVFSFRFQAFVTRSYVVPVSGISEDKLFVEGIFDSDGKTMGWPNW